MKKNEDARKQVAAGLGKLLAGSYVLLLKTHNYHWNVTGNLFVSLHTLFETQYTELFAAVDEIAERIRALGEPAPATFKAFQGLSSVKEDEAGVPEAKDMIRNLAESHEAIISEVRALIPRADEASDDVTVGLLSERLQAHEKAVWMLRALLG